MAPRRGRRSAPPSRRLILLGALNALAVAVLVAMLVRRGGDEVGPGYQLSVPPGKETLQVPGLRALSFDAGSKGLARGGAPAPRPDHHPGLSSRIEAAVSRALQKAERESGGLVGGGDTTVGVHVRDLRTGSSIVSIRGDAPLRPASSLKLLTVITALSALGVEGCFETVFEYNPTAGNLVARAGGDPMFLEGSDGSLDPWLDDLAGQLRSCGLTRVPGSLLLDEGSFQEPAPGPGWPSSSQHWAAWCGLAGGFSANGGCLTATVTPGQAGAPAAVRVRPKDHGLVRKGSVKTGPRGSQNAVAVGANRAGLTVRGSLPAGTSPFVTRFAHPDPVELFGAALAKGLTRRGIQVGDGYSQERGAWGGDVVARLRSPVLPLLRPILLESRNTIADQLLYATAHQLGLGGTRAGGELAVRQVLEGLGVNGSGLLVVDGSGLSRDNRVRPDQFTAALHAVRKLHGWEHILDGLPKAGETGSLAGRMKDETLRGRVVAKTGFIGGTSALVGVAWTLEGAQLAFALVVNYPAVAGLNTSCWKPLGDELAMLLVESEED